jgi:thiopeptide-type bacteriocin biosynthesis protein
VIIPFVPAEETFAPQRAAANVAPDRTQRRFPPGSEWLYFKLYGGLRATEDVLAGDLYGFVRSCRERGWIDRWHFVRYRDDADHIRVRVHGVAEVLRREVQPRLQDMFAGWTDSQAIWRCQLDTYERELTRYGGDAAMRTAEAIFDVDSSFVMDLLGSAPAGASPDWRWQLALRSVDFYHEALGLDAPQRERLAKASDDAFRAEFSVEPDFEGQISLRFRKDRAVLEALFGPFDRFPASLQWARAPLEAFMQALRPLTDKLAQLAAAAQLTVTVQDLASSLAHMHVNRMMLGNPREHELIIYAFLQRIHRTRRARPS